MSRYGIISSLKLVLGFILLLIQNDVFAQKEVGNNGLYLGAYYGIQWPGADMSDRYGRNFYLGGNLEFVKSGKWIFGLEGQFLFGNEVKEEVAGGIVDDRGDLINTAFAIADIDVKERGINFFAKFGRVHDLWSTYHTSGIKWTFGIGYLQHQIRLKDTRNAVPFFEDEYIKGYDRLSSGLALNQFIGYQYFDQRGRLNFFAGAEFVEAFTKNRRGFNFNTKEFDSSSRFDFLAGLKIGFQVTIVGFKQGEEDVWY